MEEVYGPLQVGALKDKPFAQRQLNLLLAYRSDEDFLFCLRNVAQVQGFAEIAGRTGLSRESLYKTLHPLARPYWKTLRKIIRAMGFELQVVPLNKGAMKRQLVRANAVAQVVPNIAQEWHPSKNGILTANDVTVLSRKKVWWLCVQGHEWKSCPANRIKGRGCPYCDAIKLLDNIKS